MKVAAGVPTTILNLEKGDLHGFIRVRKARHPDDKEDLPRGVNTSAYLRADVDQTLRVGRSTIMPGAVYAGSLPARAKQ